LRIIKNISKQIRIMKKQFYILSLALVGLFGRANAQCGWVSVGPSDSNQIAFGETFYNAIAVDPTTNTPYIAYRDGSNYFGESVKKYVGGMWMQVGQPAFSKGDGRYEAITVSKKGTVYAACQDAGITLHCSVRKYNTITMKWDTLSQVSFADPAAYISITTDTNGIPYVAYEDLGKSNKASVLMYDTLAKMWKPVGGSLGVSGGQALYTSIAFDRKNNIPYLAYEDAKDSNRLMVLSFNGVSWSTAGGATYAKGVTKDTASWVSITTDKSGNPYVSYEDASNSHGVGVMMFNTTTSMWSVVNNAGLVTGGAVNYTSIGVDASSNVYVAYQDMSKYGYSGLSIIEYTAGAWNYVGGSYKVSQAISSSAALYVSLAMDNNGKPVVTYQDKGTQHHGEAFTFNGTSWDMLGAIGLSNGSGSGWNGLASYTAIAVNSSGTPYVAYRDGNNAGKATVMSYNGSSWSVVGTPGISVAGCKFTNIGFDKAGDPICMFTDKNTTYGISVMKYSAGVWSAIGTNSATISGTYSYYVSMAIANDTIYAAYQSTNYHMAVMRSPVSGTGACWTQVGAADITGDTAAYQSIAIDKNGTPYLAFSDNRNASGITVMKYAGGSWQTVGAVNISGGKGVYTSIQIDPKTNMPVVAYSSYGSGPEANVQSFNGTSWSYVQKPGISIDWSNYMSLTISKGDEYYIVYEDWGNKHNTQGQGNCTAMKFTPGFDTAWQYLPVNGSVSNGGAGYVAATVDGNGNVYAAYSGYSAFVKKLICPTAINEVQGDDNTSKVSVYPNPSHGIFNIALQNVTGKSYIEVYNILGEKVYQVQLHSNNTQINIGANAPGIYLYRVITESGEAISSGKMILQ
jgi:hypothetical protein